MSEPTEIIGKKIVQGNRSIIANVEAGGTLNFHIHPDNKQEKPKEEAGFFFPTASGTLPCLYYNLIVGYSPFEKNTILIPRDRVLTEYVDDAVKAKFSEWSIERMDNVRDYPAIIIDELDKNIADKQQGALALIQDVFLQENGARICFQPLGSIPMSFLVEQSFELAISSIFELHRTHWTIKQADIFFALESAGVTISQIPRVDTGRVLLDDFKQRISHPKRLLVQP